MRGVFNKNGLLIVAILGMVGYLFYPLKSRWTPSRPDDVVIQLWHPWSGVYADSLNEVIAEFNRTHPGIVARPLFIPSSAGDRTKFFISVAGNVPPDVCMVDGTDVAAWAHLGVLQPLDERLAEAGMKEEDFWGPSWKQCRYNNKIWAASIVADPNFALVWNKELFREAGLDPERPPMTLDELTAYCDKLTQYDPRTGRIVRLGIMPALVYSDANAMFTWGWAFGGEFYDEATQTFTPDHPRVLDALNWLLFMRDRYGGQVRQRSFKAGFGDASQNPFYVGKLAMMVMYISEAQEISRFAPNLEFGIAPLPAPTGGEYGSSWVGGWTMAMPYGGRGNNDAAFELIRWMAHDPHGSAFLARKMHVLPAFKKSPFFDEVKGNRVLETYYQILQNCKYQRPVSPANAYFIDELNRAVSRTIEGVIGPEQALRECRERTMIHLEKQMAQTVADHVK